MANFLHCQSYIQRAASVTGLEFCPKQFLLFFDQFQFFSDYLYWRIWIIMRYQYLIIIWKRSFRSVATIWNLLLILLSVKYSFCVFMSVPVKREISCLARAAYTNWQLGNMKVSLRLFESTLCCLKVSIISKINSFFLWKNFKYVFLSLESF